MFESLFDLWQFIRERGNFWLAPIVLVLTPLLVLMSLFGLLTVIGETSSLSPFMYTLF
jgi:hypothetical protein